MGDVVVVDCVIVVVVMVVAIVVGCVVVWGEKMVKFRVFYSVFLGTA